MSGTKKEHDEYAVDRWSWMTSLVEVGFTREEAMQILTMPLVQIHGGLTPEVSQLVERMNAMMTRDLVEDS